MNKKTLGFLLVAAGGYFLWKKHKQAHAQMVAAVMPVTADVDDFRLMDDDAENVQVFKSYSCRSAN